MTETKRTKNSFASSICGSITGFFGVLLSFQFRNHKKQQQQQWNDMRSDWNCFWRIQCWFEQINGNSCEKVLWRTWYALFKHYQQTRLHLCRRFRYAHTYTLHILCIDCSIDQSTWFEFTFNSFGISHIRMFRIFFKWINFINQRKVSINWINLICRWEFRQWQSGCV